MFFEPVADGLHLLFLSFSPTGTVDERHEPITNGRGHTFVLRGERQGDTGASELLLSTTRLPFCFLFASPHNLCFSFMPPFTLNRLTVGIFLDPYNLRVGQSAGPKVPTWKEGGQLQLALKFRARMCAPDQRQECKTQATVRAAAPTPASATLRFLMWTVCAF